METEQKDLLQITDQATTQNTRGGRGVIYSVLLNILFITIIIIGVWNGYAIYQRMQAQEEIDKQQIVANRASLDSQKAVITMLQESQQLNAQALAELYQQKGSRNQDWALAEIEYLLVIALHRLQLERDVKTALAAMKAAELRFQGLHGLSVVHRQLLLDIEQLQSLEVADIEGLATHLTDLINEVDALPLRPIAVTITTSEKNSQSWWGKIIQTIWNQLRHSVVIFRNDKNTLVSLPPDKEYFLYQNLRLELVNARYSLLRADTENFHISIALIQNWLNDYFDKQNEQVSNAIYILKKMILVDLDTPVPDINSSLESLRAYIHNTESMTEGSIQ